MGGGEAGVVEVEAVEDLVVVVARRGTRVAGSLLSATPYSLDRLLLRVPYGAVGTPGVGAVTAQGFIGTGDHPADRHLQVPVGIGLLDPVIGVHEPMVAVFFALEGEPGDFIPAPDENRLCIRTVGRSTSAEIVEFDQVRQVLAVPAAGRNTALAPFVDAVQVVHFEHGLIGLVGQFLDAHRE